MKSFPSYFITGAAQGIGKQIAIDLSKSNQVNIGILDFDEPELLRDVANECKLNGANVYIYHQDVVDRTGMQSCVKDFLSLTDRIDVVFANAGVSSQQNNLSEINDEDLSMKVNYFGVINTLSPFIPFMVRKGFGTLVISNSISALVSTQSSAYYSGSKSAIRAWSDSLRLQLSSKNICVVDCTLGFIKTRMIEGLPHAGLLSISTSKASKLILRSVHLKKSRPSIPRIQNLIWFFLRLLPISYRNKLLNRIWKSLNTNNLRDGQ